MNRNHNCVLKIAGLEFSYQSAPVLKGVSLIIEEGDRFAILGPNGTGKTTFLKCLNRKLKPKGSIMLEDRNLETFSRREIARKIGFVPQESETTSSFTGLEIILMGRYAHGGGFARTNEHDPGAIRDILRETGTTDFAHRPFCRLSGGEKQRIIIARALYQNPGILLCDEPTLHLDLKSQVEILSLLKKSSQRGNLTILFASHDINLAFQFAEKILLFSEGRIYAAGGREVLTENNLKTVFGIAPKMIEKDGATFFATLLTG
ncbi:MAG: ABC transporter ATP-binding protein [Candidatus Omnitrophota bacterium]